MLQWSLVSTSRRFNLPRIWIWGGRCIKCWLGGSGAILLKKNFRSFKIAIWKVKACLELIFLGSLWIFFLWKGGGLGGGSWSVWGSEGMLPLPSPNLIKNWRSASWKILLAFHNLFSNGPAAVCSVKNVEKKLEWQISWTDYLLCSWLQSTTTRLLGNTRHCLTVHPPTNRVCLYTEISISASIE